MMKKKLTVGLLTIFTFLLSACMSVNTYPDADKYLVGSKTYTETIQEITIDWISGNITLIEDNTMVGVEIVEETNLTKDEERVHTYVHDGILNVKYFASGYTKSSLNYIQKDLFVTYKPSLSKLTINQISGNLVAESVNCDDFRLNMTSGNATIETINVARTTLNLTSGNLDFDHVIADQLDVSMTSGTLTMGMDTVGSVDIKMTSGNVYLTLPANGAQVTITKVSGTINANRTHTQAGNLYTFGVGGATIKISITSGSIYLD